MVRFQADADLNQIIVSALLRRNSAVDFRTAANPSLKGLSDLDVLALAAAETRVLVTHDSKTMPRHCPGRRRCRSSSSTSISPADAAGDAVAMLASESRANHRRAWRLPDGVVAQIPGWVGMIGRRSSPSSGRP